MSLIYNLQPLAVSSDGAIATAPGGVLCMRSTSSKVLTCPQIKIANISHFNALVNDFLFQTIALCHILSQATWIKRAVSAWEMGGWMKGLAEGGYGINIARNVAIMQELQVRIHLCLDVTAEVRCSRPYPQAALELQPGSATASADERSITSPRGSIGRASNSSPIPALFSSAAGAAGEFSSDGSSRGSLAAEEGGSSAGTSSSKQQVFPLSLCWLCCVYLRLK